MVTSCCRTYQMFWFSYGTMDFPADCPVPNTLYYPNTVGASGWGQWALWPLWRCEVLLEVKGQRQNCHTWMCAHLWADRQQLTAPHAADRPSPWSRLGSPGESPRVRGCICDRWPSSLRFSHLSLAHIWGGAASESVAFLICHPEV